MQISPLVKTLVAIAVVAAPVSPVAAQQGEPTRAAVIAALALLLQGVPQPSGELVAGNLTPLMDSDHDGLSDGFESYLATASTSPSTWIARRLRSARLPIGVATT